MTSTTHTVNSKSLNPLLIFWTITMPSVSIQDPTKIDDDSTSTGSTRSSSPQPHSISETEATFYYAGLPSSPKLIYRTGTTLWTKSTGLKELRPVFGHTLNAIWKDVNPEVCDILDSVGVRWTTIDVVRFSTKVGEEEAIGPVVLWIGVLPETLSSEDARADTAARRCLNRLKESGITDVEIEFRESIYTRSANLREHVSNESDPTAKVCGPLTPALGLSIAADATPSCEGTGGFYLAEGGGSQNILLVTARHVLFPPKTVIGSSNVDYTYKDTDATRENVLLLGEKAFKKLVKSIQDSITEREDAAKRYDQSFKHWSQKWMIDHGDEEISGEAKDKLDMIQGSLNKENNAVVALRDFQDDVTNEWSEPSQRFLGHIVCSPRLSCGTESTGFTEDYAVVKLVKSKIEKAFMGNVIDLGTKISVDEFTLMMRDHRPDAPTTFEYPNNHLLKLQANIIPEEDMRNPDMLDHKHEPCLYVIKNGFATGVTIGRANGIFSKTREYFDDRPLQESTEWAIHSYDNKFSPFSTGGDSGSVIVDGRGRMGGLLTGGCCGATMALDITYATPLFWLLPRIKANGFPDAHLLA